MLILTRKLDEEIKINNEVTIKVISISENSIKIGISAPADVQIVRGELYEKIKESSLEASKSIKEKPENYKKLRIKKID